jgi:hypothetical protein
VFIHVSFVVMPRKVVSNIRSYYNTIMQLDLDNLVKISSVQPAYANVHFVGLRTIDYSRSVFIRCNGGIVISCSMAQPCGYLVANIFTIAKAESRANSAMGNTCRCVLPCFSLEQHCTGLQHFYATAYHFSKWWTYREHDYGLVVIEQKVRSNLHCKALIR